MKETHDEFQCKSKLKKIEEKLDELINQVSKILGKEPENADFITPAHLEQRYHVPYTTFQRWKRNGLIDVYKVPGTGKLYIRESEYLKLLEKGKI
jgi:hypothetical protein